jgi:hypothetical protein
MRGTVAYNLNTEMLTFVAESRFRNEEEGWLTDTGSYRHDATITGNLLRLVGDGDLDGECDVDCAFDDGETVDWSTDVLMNLSKQPATLTLTGTVTMQPATSSGGQVGVAVTKDSFTNAAYTWDGAVTSGTTSFTYSISGVVPGNYVIGAGFDADGNGEYTDIGDYLGSIGREPGGIAFPLYEGHTVADFVLEEEVAPE